MCRPRMAGSVVLALGSLAGVPTLAAQEPPAPVREWEVAALPTLNYDADEGFGYGALAELYRHAPGARPYVFTVQPSVQLSTRGKRDVTMFFDAPHLLPGDLRLDLYAGREQQLASPYYGRGNATAYDASLDAADGLDPYFYRFGRTRTLALANLQRPVAGLPVRLLVGGGVSHVEIDPTPYDHGTTLLERQLGGSRAPGGYSNSVRAGVIWDTRDRETGPTRGTWSEILVQRVDAALGSDHEYTRWTVTDRRYIPVGSPRLVLANRLLLQGVSGDAPFYDLFVVQTSFKQQEGLGGAKTVRGLPKNRYVGDGLFLWNAELRWRAVETRVGGRAVNVVLTGFVDSGRVWDGEVVLREIGSSLHHGIGGGVRLGLGDGFTVAVDGGRAGAGTPIYVGLGYLF